MNKKYKISLISLIATCAVSTAVAVALPASAERTVSVNGSSVFQALSNANVTAYQNDAKYYPLFNFVDDNDSIVYRRNLAYSWYQGGEKDGLNLNFGFADLTFDSYTITFQSQQYVETEEGVTSNHVVFVTANDASGVYAYVTSDSEDLERTAEELEGANAQFISAEEALNIELTFGEKTGANFAVTLAGEGYVFENIGGNYAKYVSSSKTDPTTPLTFSANFAEEAEEGASMILYNLNNQSFELVSSTVQTVDGALTSGDITDNVAPVLVLDDEVNFIEMGSELDVATVAIDVVASSPTVTPSYYILTTEQANNASFNATAAENFKEIDDDDEVYFMDTNSSYTPAENELPSALRSEEFEVTCLTKIVYKLSDVSTDNATSTEVYLDWYVKNTATVNGNSYICVGDDTKGATYIADQTAIEEYQAKIDELTKDENGQPTLLAGSSNYLYLPSVETLLSDDIDDYTDLKFSIYYNSDSKQSKTSLAYNKLSINVNTDGVYTFTVYATDLSGNTMYYLNDEGEMEQIVASSIWDFFDDEELHGIVPWFTFKVGYTAATVEAPGLQDTGYVDTRYTADKFEINGVSGKYTETYTLTLFDRALYTEEVGEISYQEFVEKVDELYEGESRKYFRIIPAATTIAEEDENYELYSEYSWNTSSLSFVPQEEGKNSFYVIRLELKDEVITSNTITKYMAISVSAKSTPLAGESDWLKNNLASIILFSIAGVSFIGLIVLFVMNPKRNSDIELVEENENSKK